MNCGRLEKLKMVFQLDSKLEGEIEIGRSAVQKLTAVGGIGDVRVLELVVKTMERLSLGDVFKKRNGAILSTREALTQVEKQKKWKFTLEAGGLLFRSGELPAFQQSFVLIEELQVGASRSWSDWVTPFLSEPTFVQAWISDVEYDYWQNAEDPIEYKTKGREYLHLPMKTNGLPYPLEQQVVDISRNPGRWTMNDGYVEVVGSTMWLGKLFWQLVGDQGRRGLDSIEGLRTLDVGEGVLQVIAANDCFCDERTKAVQESIRAALFNS